MPALKLASRVVVLIELYLQRGQVREFLDLFECTLIDQLVVLKVAPLHGSMTCIVDIAFAGDFGDVRVCEEGI